MKSPKKHALGRALYTTSISNSSKKEIISPVAKENGEETSKGKGQLKRSEIPNKSSEEGRRVAPWK